MSDQLKDNPGLVRVLIESLDLQTVEALLKIINDPSHSGYGTIEIRFRDRKVSHLNITESINIK